MNKLKYNDWMAYIYNTIYKQPGKDPKRGTIGNRSMKQIQKEIEDLREIDRIISEQVNSQYTKKK